MPTASNTDQSSTSAGTPTVRVLVVDPDETRPVETTDALAEHATFCRLVADSNTDAVFFNDKSAVAFVAANGKRSTAHLLNIRATTLVEAFVPGFAKRDRIEGPAVIVGLDSAGQFADVPQDVLTLADNLYPNPTRA